MTPSPSTSSQGISHPTGGDSLDTTMIHDASSRSDGDERVAVSILRSTPLVQTNSNQTTRSGRGSTHLRETSWLRLARQEGCLNFVSPILACPAEGPSIGRMTWHLATQQRLEPVGPDREYGTGVPRGTASCRARLASSEYRPCLTTPALDRANLAFRVLKDRERKRGVVQCLTEAAVKSIICR